MPFVSANHLFGFARFPFLLYSFYYFTLIWKTFASSTNEVLEVVVSQLLSTVQNQQDEIRRLRHHQAVRDEELSLLLQHASRSLRFLAEKEESTETASALKPACPRGSFSQDANASVLYTLCTPVDLSILASYVSGGVRDGFCEWFGASSLVLSKAQGASGFVFEVGANFGRCSLLLAVLGLNVVSYEPNPQLVDFLRAGMRLNDVALRAAGGTLEVKAALLGTEVGLTRVTLGSQDSVLWPDRSSDQTQFQFSPLLVASPTQDVHVQASTLDSEVYSLSRRLLSLRLDVGGEEGRVLAGAKRLLAQDAPPLVTLTFWPSLQRAKGGDPLAVLDVLDASGYQMFAYDLCWGACAFFGEVMLELVPGAPLARVAPLPRERFVELVSLLSESRATTPSVIVVAAHWQRMRQVISSADGLL